VLLEVIAMRVKLAMDYFGTGTDAAPRHNLKRVMSVLGIARTMKAMRLVGA
jgi:hypothetical protein